MHAQTARKSGQDSSNFSWQCGLPGSPRILETPRTASQAAAHVRLLRKTSGVAFCAYDPHRFPESIGRLESKPFPYQRAHDVVLGATLRANGVKVFYTQNTKDSADAGFTRLIDPFS